MSININDAGTWRDIKSVHVNDAGTWRDIKSVHVNDAGTWRQVYVGVTASASPSSVSYVGPSGGIRTTGPSVCTGLPAGGTYLWQQTGGDPMTINSPNSQSTTFSHALPTGADFTGFFRCTYTLGGTSVQTNQVQAVIVATD